MLYYVVTAMDGSDGLRPSKDRYLPSVSGTGSPAPHPWRQCHWACGHSSLLCGRWGLVTGAGLPGQGWGGLCPAVSLCELHSGFTTIWVTERLTSSGETSTFSSVKWEHRPYRVDTAPFHGQSSSRTCEDTLHVVWGDTSGPFPAL